MLACPRCGGNVAATNHACEYCTAELLVRACPRCFSRIFHEAKHCSSCGAQAVVPAAANADGEAAPRSCPRCSTRLVGYLVDEVLLDECPGCQGVWVDLAALERILDERRQVRAEAILGRPASTAVAEPGVSYIRCPDCAALMNRRLFARGAGIIVDLCPSHGTWFDGGELPAVIEFVMKGGLEAAARKEALSLEEDRRRLQAQQRSAGTPIGGRGSPADFRTPSDGIEVFASMLGAIGRLLARSNR